MSLLGYLRPRQVLLHIPKTGGTALALALEARAMKDDILIGDTPKARARRGRIGIVLQAFHLLPTMTALENVAVPLELAGIDDPFGRAEAELAAVGLGHRTGHYPTQLSGGEQQRVALARAFVMSPAVLLADEPTGSLDFATGQTIMELMFDLNRELGTTLVMVTHDRSIAERCERRITIAAGEVAEISPG